MPDRLTDPITILRQTHAIDGGTVAQVQRLVDQGKELQQRGHTTSAQKFFNRASNAVANTAVSGLAHGETADVQIVKGKTPEGYNVTNVTATASNSGMLPKSVHYDYREAVTMTATGDGKSQNELQQTAAKLLARDDIITVLPVNDMGLLARLTGKTVTEINLAQQGHAEKRKLQELKDLKELQEAQIKEEITLKQHKLTPVSKTDLQKARAKSNREAKKWYEELGQVEQKYVKVKTIQGAAGFFSSIFGGSQTREISFGQDKTPPATYSYSTHDPYDNMAHGFQKAAANAKNLGDSGITYTRTPSFLVRLFGGE